MNPGEIAVDEIGEETTRALQGAAEMENNRAQRVASMHRGVKDAGSDPALRAGRIVGNEQAPDRLLRRRADRGSARHVANSGDEAGDGPFVPYRLACSRIEALPQLILRALAPCLVTRRDRGQRHAGDTQHTTDAQHQNAVDQRSAQVELAIEASVIRKTSDLGPRIGLHEIDQTGDAKRSTHRRPPPYFSQGKYTLRILAKCGRSCGTCRSSTVRRLLSCTHA